MNQVIVPLDGSEAGERSLDLARTLANASQGSMMLVRAIPKNGNVAIPSATLARLEDESRRYLKRQASRIRDVGVDTRILHGDLADSLVAAAEDSPQSMIVMSARGSHDSRQSTVGAMAEKVVRGATVPVALVPPTKTPSSLLTNILVPLDGSRLAENALSPAVHLARATGATVHLMRAVEPFWRANGIDGFDEYSESSQYGRDIDEQSRIDAVAYLEDVATQVRSRQVRLEWSVRFGRPVEEIRRAADNETVDLIVVATHGYGGIRRWALGSVTTDLLRSATVPVLVIPPASRRIGLGRGVRRRRAR